MTRRELEARKVAAAKRDELMTQLYAAKSPAQAAAVKSQIEALPKFPEGEAAGVLQITRGGFLGDEWTAPVSESFETMHRSGLDYDPYDPDVSR